MSIRDELLLSSSIYSFMLSVFVLVLVLCLSLVMTKETFRRFEILGSETSPLNMLCHIFERAVLHKITQVAANKVFKLMVPSLVFSFLLDDLPDLDTEENFCEWSKWSNSIGTNPNSSQSSRDTNTPKNIPVMM